MDEGKIEKFKTINNDIHKLKTPTLIKIK